MKVPEQVPETLSAPEHEFEYEFSLDQPEQLRATREARVSRPTTGLAVGISLAVVLGCLADPGVEVELTDETVTLSGEALVLSADDPLPAEAFFLGVCLSPGSGYNVSGRWTVLTPDGREAQVVARAELVNGDTVKLVSPSSSGNSLCVHPRRGGPFESPVRRVRLVASTPIVVERVVWRSGGP